MTLMPFVKKIAQANYVTTYRNGKIFSVTSVDFPFESQDRIVLVLISHNEFVVL